MFGNLSPRGERVVSMSHDRILKSQAHIDRRNELINQWNKEEAFHWLPAKKWTKGDRVSDTFSKKAIFIMILSFLLGGIPYLFLVPFMLKISTRRKKLSDSILREESTIKSILPIPFDKEDFLKIKETVDGRELIEEGIIFENSYIKEGVQ